MLQTYGFSKEMKLCYLSVKKKALCTTKKVWKIRFTSDSEKFSKIYIKKSFQIRNLMYEFNVNHLY